MSLLSAEQWRTYHEVGFLKLGRVLEAAELKALQERIDEIMLGRATLDYGKILMQLDSDSGEYGKLGPQTRGHKGATLKYRKIQDLEQDPLFLAYMQRPLFRELCAGVYGADQPVSTFRAMFMNKPAGMGTLLPWHQDGGEGWGLDRHPLLTVWTALDPATLANGCVEVLPGTHKLGLLSRFGHTITPEQEAQYCPEERVVPVELEAGEVAIFHNWLLHRSGVNRTTTPRRGFSVCYAHGETRLVKGKGYLPRVFGEGALTPAGRQAVAQA